MVLRVRKQKTDQLGGIKLTVKYFSTYNFNRIGEYTALEEAQQAIKDHPEYYKSKYTKKGAPRSNYSELKRFAISDNNGNLYYIY